MPNGARRVGPPERLTTGHDISDFSCGEPALDGWLRRRAQQNEASGGSGTYVRAGLKVAGYDTLAAGALSDSQAMKGTGSSHRRWTR